FFVASRFIGTVGRTNPEPRIEPSGAQIAHWMTWPGIPDVSTSTATHTSFVTSRCTSHRVKRRITKSSIYSLLSTVPSIYLFIFSHNRGPGFQEWLIHLEEFLKELRFIHPHHIQHFDRLHV